MQVICFHDFHSTFPKKRSAGTDKIQAHDMSKHRLAVTCKLGDEEKSHWTVDDPSWSQGLVYQYVCSDFFVFYLASVVAPCVTRMHESCIYHAEWEGGRESMLSSESIAFETCTVKVTTLIYCGSICWILIHQDLIYTEVFRTLRTLFWSAVTRFEQFVEYLVDTSDNTP